MVGLDTKAISVDEGEDALMVKVEYSLDINYQHISECSIMVDVRSRSHAQVKLLES